MCLLKFDQRIIKLESISIQPEKRGSHKFSHLIKYKNLSSHLNFVLNFKDGKPNFST